MSSHGPGAEPRRVFPHHAHAEANCKPNVSTAADATADTHADAQADADADSLTDSSADTQAYAHPNYAPDPCTYTTILPRGFGLLRGRVCQIGPWGCARNTEGPRNEPI
jgi:hypothetical protein